MTNDKKEEKATEQLTVEYDEKLEKLLMEHNFKHTNISEFFTGISTRYSYLHIHKDEVSERIEAMKKDMVNGCIFTLPGSRRDGMKYIYFVPISVKQMRRYLKMKALI